MTESGMHATTDPADAFAAALPPHAPSDDAMTALYRAALGPVHPERYLALFARFDATGRATTGWNWAASLCTLNWMVFRKLWSAALVYVAAAESLALLVWGVGRPLLHWPAGVEWGVLGAFAVLAFAVPGLYGDAIVHADIRKRTTRALAASRTVAQACALLQRQASTRGRLRALVLVNLVIGMAAVLAWLAAPRAGEHSAVLEPALTVAQAASASTPAAAALAERTQHAPRGPGASGPVVALEEAAPDAGAAAPPVEMAAPAQRAPSSDPGEPLPDPSPVPAPAPAASLPPPPPGPAAIPAGRQRGAGAPSAPAAVPDTAAASPLPAVGTPAGYYINVGLFADEANARKAQARLLNEGLPAFRQTLNHARGRLTRVRVGPYDSAAQAQAAAQTIRALALDAVVFRQ